MDTDNRQFREEVERKRTFTYKETMEQQLKHDMQIPILQSRIAELEAENKRLKDCGRDVLDAWRSGEETDKYEELIDKAFVLFGGRK